MMSEETFYKIGWWISMIAWSVVGGGGILAIISIFIYRSIIGWDVPMTGF